MGISQKYRHWVHIQSVHAEKEMAAHAFFLAHLMKGARIPSSDQCMGMIAKSSAFCTCQHISFLSKISMMQRGAILWPLAHGAMAMHVSQDQAFVCSLSSRYMMQRKPQHTFTALGPPWWSQHWCGFGEKVKLCTFTSNKQQLWPSQRLNCKRTW